jgi:serine/threonine protein kinase
MPAPGDLLAGRYRIVAPLGSGGMATVHRARDERLERDVAVKILLPNHAGDPATAARFEREARSLAAATHPNVVAVYDVDAGDPAAGRDPFFVMELCPGGSLATRMAAGRRMAPDELVPILVSVADGLADLHRRGVVHRDVKPQNILLAADRAKLADFGLAQADDNDGLSDLTAPGTAVGTLAYLAPEVLGGERASAAADVYALGVVAFVAMTGEWPRPAGSMAALVAASQTPARRLSSASPELGPAFDDVIAATLAARPADRPDALDVSAGLTAALGRWSRDGGPARWASAAAVAAGAAGLVTGSAAAAASAPAARSAEDATTATALPLGQTARIPVGRRASAPPWRPRRVSAGWLLPAASLLAVVLAALLILPRLSDLLASPGGGQQASLAAASASPSASPSASLSPSPSPSIAVSPSVALSPSPDPAFAAIDAMDAAIAAARGGSDGLKGKEANDLETMAAAVRRALTSGDRRAALDAARKLDQRVSDLADKLGRDQAARLQAASANLVQAL